MLRHQAIAASLLLLAAPCMALECPTPQPAGAPGAIQETPAQTTELSEVSLPETSATEFPFSSICFEPSSRRAHGDWCLLVDGLPPSRE